MDKVLNKKGSSRLAHEKLHRLQNNGKLFNARKVYHYNSLVVKSVYAFFTIICAVLLLYLTACVILDVIITSQTTFEPFECRVRQGDTLWSLAKRYQPDGISFSQYWDWVCSHNENADIYPGDIILMAKVI